MKQLKVYTVVFFSIFIIHGLAFADKGVFNASALPDETFTDTPTTVTVTAEVGAENLYISSVQLYETTEDGRPISRLGQMYDDGTHGDTREADTIFTAQIELNESSVQTVFVRVSAAYRGERNRYLSQVIPLTVYKPIPAGASSQANSILQGLEASFLNYLSTMGVASAAEQVLRNALANPAISSAELVGNTISIQFASGIRGIVILSDPDNPTRAPGSSVPILPSDTKFPGNDKVMIFSPYYGFGFLPGELFSDSDDAKDYFSNSVYMEFNPSPVTITKNESASLEVVKSWGNYGAVVVDAHGGVWSNEVVICSGTEATAANTATYGLDLAAGRIAQSSGGNYCFFPSFITKHSVSMKDTLLWLGSCHSLANNTMWNALRNKGAKVALGWTDTVGDGFANGRFEEIFEAMLPDDDNVDLVTVKQAFDAVPDKTDDGFCIFGWCSGNGATLTLETAGAEWDNFVFAEGGIVNGDFETGDWTGWTHGGDYNFRLISGARKHTGSDSAALGRWDTAFHGHNPIAEPYGYEWFYQDFVVPSNVSILKFHWWMETYDTAVWDWFDAYIKDTNGNTLKTVLSRAGKPGTNYGPYWTTSGWQEVQVDITEYQGQTIRIYFDQRLDGWGDQQRVYIDDVVLE